jgi:predicted MFS family arabinose efflux permease
MKVQRYAVVRDQHRSRGPGEQLVELRGHLRLVTVDGKDRAEIITSGAGVTKVGVADLDRAGFVVLGEQGPQVSGRGQEVAVAWGGGRVDQGDREPGPASRSEPDVSTHLAKLPDSVTLICVKPVTSTSGNDRRLGRGGVRLLTSATVSRLADAAAEVAIVLFVIARTHDSRLAGLVVAAFALPTLVSGPVLGAYLDGLRAKRALFAGNQLLLASALTVVLVLAGHVPGVILVGAGLCAGVTAPVLAGGFSSLVPLVVPRPALPRANAADAASYSIAGLGGPALVAVIAGPLGTGAALGAVAAIAAAGLLLVLAVPMPASRHPARADSLAAAVTDGLRLLWRVPLLRSTTVTTTLGQFAWGLLPVTLPLLAIQLGYRAAAGGWLLTAISGGALIGAIASERLLSRRSPRAVIIAGMAGFGLSLAALAFMPRLGLAIPLAVLAGIGDGPVLAATFSVRQQCVPAHRYAQFSATSASIKIGSYAAGAAAAGLLSTALTARQLLLAAAGIQLLALLPMLQARTAASEPATSVVRVP